MYLPFCTAQLNTFPSIFQDGSHLLMRIWFQRNHIFTSEERARADMAWETRRITALEPSRGRFHWTSSARGVYGCDLMLSRRNGQSAKCCSQGPDVYIYLHCFTIFLYYYTAPLSSAAYPISILYTQTRAHQNCQTISLTSSPVKKTYISPSTTQYRQHSLIKALSAFI